MEAFTFLLFLFFFCFLHLLYAHSNCSANGGESFRVGITTISSIVRTSVLSSYVKCKKKNQHRMNCFSHIACVSSHTTSSNSFPMGKSNILLRAWEKPCSQSRSKLKAVRITAFCMPFVGGSFSLLSCTNGLKFGLGVSLFLPVPDHDVGEYFEMRQIHFHN